MSLPGLLMMMRVDGIEQLSAGGSELTIIIMTRIVGAAPSADPEHAVTEYHAPGPTGGPRPALQDK